MTFVPSRCFHAGTGLTIKARLFSGPFTFQRQTNPCNIIYPLAGWKEREQISSESIEMAIVFLALLFCVGSSLAAPHDHCVSKDITLDQKLQLNADANDPNHDNITTGVDIDHDLRDNYDTNGDGAVDENEWIARWTCAFGDTAYFARFAFNMISRGQPVLRIDYTGREPYASGFPRATFISLNRNRYELFQKYMCVNTNLTMDQKLARILIDNNHNNDSVVDSSDIFYDLSNHYDTDNDTKVTEQEWMVRWCCAYGDTAAYARYVWNLLTQGTGSISTSQFNVPPFDAGIPLAAFRETNRKRYESYAASQMQPPVGR